MRLCIRIFACAVVGAVVISLPIHATAQERSVLPRLELECDPLDPALALLVPESRLRCGVGIQSNLGSEFGNHVSTFAVDSEGAVRALIARGEPALALLTPGPITHFGAKEDTVYWGIWMPGPMRRFEGTQERGSYAATVAQPYVGGITAAEYLRHDLLSGRATSAAAVPTEGTITYEMLGSPFVASRDEVNFRSNLIDPGPIRRASVQVDFVRGTAVARLAYTVRGVEADFRFDLVRRKPPSNTFESVSCTDTGYDICSHAELRFYGRQGEFAGLLFTLNYNTAMSEGQRVPARLNNVKGYGAVAVERH
jgi:hypothetical protein